MVITGQQTRPTSQRFTAGNRNVSNRKLYDTTQTNYICLRIDEISTMIKSRRRVRDHRNRSKEDLTSVRGAATGEARLKRSLPLGMLRNLSSNRCFNAAGSSTTLA